jgi:acetyltransferase-like isoleucine patch superfamily enzyme
MATGTSTRSASSAARPVVVRRAPRPLHGGPLTLLRFLRANRMLSPRYARLALRWAWLKLRWRGRLETDGLCFIAPGVEFEIGRHAKVMLGRWCWIGHRTKIRVHEGELTIGAKTVLGQECTLSAYQRISIGRECIIADRSMFIDFDHSTEEVDRPIRAQGIHKRDVSIGHNVWVGHAASFLRGVTVGHNSVVGAGAVVCDDVPDNAVVGGVPAKVIRMRRPPEVLRWE